MNQLASANAVGVWARRAAYVARSFSRPPPVAVVPKQLGRHPIALNADAQAPAALSRHEHVALESHERLEAGVVRLDRTPNRLFEDEVVPRPQVVSGRFVRNTGDDGHGQSDRSSGSPR